MNISINLKNLSFTSTAITAWFLCQICIANAAQIVVKGDTLEFSGLISNATLPEFNDALTDKIKKIKVTSLGGDANVAIKIANIISQKGVKIIVDRYCLSACANYLFVASAEKSILPGSILGFHGGFAGAAAPVFEALDFPKVDSIDRKTMEESIVKPFNKLVEEFQKNEKVFYDKFGVNSELLQFSMKKLNLDKKSKAFVISCQEIAFDKKENSLNFKCGSYPNSGNSYYFPSEETLSRYGVKGITSYPYPRNEIELENLVENAFIYTGIKYDIKADF